MAVLTWPTFAIPAEFTLSRFTHVLRGTSLFGKTGQNVDTLNDRWLINCSISLRDRDDSAELEAFVNNLRSGGSTVLCHHFARPSIEGSLTNPTTQNQALGVESLLISCQPGDYLKAGDMLGIGDQLFQVAFDCSTSSNTLTVPVTMRSRKAISAGVSLVISEPKGKFRLSNVASTTFSPGGITMGVDLELVEVLT